MAWTKRRVAAAVAAYLALACLWPMTDGLRAIFHALNRMLPGLHVVFGILFEGIGTILWSAYPVFVLVATFLGSAIAVLRIARRAAPGTARDPLVQLRDAMRAHPNIASVLPWLPWAYWLYDAAPEVVSRWDPLYIFSAALAGVVTTVTGKVLLRTLDRVENREPLPPPQVASQETVFRAVAVTRRSQAIVFGAIGVAISMIVFIGSVNLGRFGSGQLGALALAYAFFLGVTARWFQTASKIRVGTDGVFVQGTSRTRFYAYRDFDSVRVSGPTLHLLHGSQTIVRLQLHGADLHRGTFLGERIETALAAAKNVSGAESLVAHGGNALAGGDYRNAALSREQLWELIEADGTAGGARAAAAKMLAPSLDENDKSRLRLAAAHMADPKVRIALEEVAQEDRHRDDDDDEVALGARSALANRLGRS